MKLTKTKQIRGMQWSFAAQKKAGSKNMKQTEILGLVEARKVQKKNNKAVIAGYVEKIMV